MRFLTLGIVALAVLVAVVLVLVRSVGRERSAERALVPSAAQRSAARAEGGLAEPALVVPDAAALATRTPAPAAVGAKAGAGFALPGRIVDGRGAAVEGVTVSMLGPPRPRGKRRGRRTLETTSDAHGRFRFEGLARGAWRLDVRGDDVGHLRRDVEVGPELGELVLTVERGNCVAFELAWSDGQEPEELELLLTPDTSPTRRVLERGAFRLCGLVPGRVRVAARATRGGRVGFAAAEVEVPAARPLRLLLTEAEPIEVTGHVRDELGQPVPGARLVVAHERSASAALDPGGELRVAGAVLDVPLLSDGSFAFTLAPGKQWLGALAQGYTLEHRELTLDGPLAPQEFVLARLARLAGVVLDAEGRALRGARLEGGGYAASLQASAPTRGNGSFSIVSAPGLRELVARHPGYAPSEPLTLFVAPGAEVQGLVLRLRPGCRLRGLVRDEDGTPLASALLLAGKRAERSDEQGRFELAGLAPGRTWVQVWHPRLTGEDALSIGSEIELVPGVPAELELVFRARDPVRLRGHIEHGPGRALEVLLVGGGLGHRAQASAQGTFAQVLAHPGRWRGTLSARAARPNAEPPEVRLFELEVPDADEHVLTLDWERLLRSSSREETEAFLRVER